MNAAFIARVPVPPVPVVASGPVGISAGCRLRIAQSLRVLREWVTQARRALRAQWVAAGSIQLDRGRQAHPSHARTAAQRAGFSASSSTTSASPGRATFLRHSDISITTLHLRLLETAACQRPPGGSAIHHVHFDRYAFDLSQLARQARRTSAIRARSAICGSSISDPNDGSVSPTSPTSARPNCQPHHRALLPARNSPYSDIRLSGRAAAHHAAGAWRCRSSPRSASVVGATRESASSHARRRPHSGSVFPPYPRALVRLVFGYISAFRASASHHFLEPPALLTMPARG